jgi:hypothetical protein
MICSSASPWLLIVLVGIALWAKHAAPPVDAEQAPVAEGFRILRRLLVVLFV